MQRAQQLSCMWLPLIDTITKTVLTYKIGVRKSSWQEPAARANLPDRIDGWYDAQSPGEQ